MRGILIIYLIIQICVNSPAFTQNKYDYQGFFFKKKIKKKAIMPFKQHNNLVIIPLVFNKTDTLNFILDTGVKYMLLTDNTIAEKFNLPKQRELEIFGADRKYPLKAYVSNIEEVSWGHQVRATKQGLIVLEEDITQLSEHTGVKIHGLIGADIFGHFIVKIDYIKQELTLWHPEKYQFKKKGKWEKFDLELISSIPYIEAEVRTTADYFSKLKLMLDTGAGHALLLDIENHSINLDMPKNAIHSRLGNALGGTIYGNLARTEEILLADFSLTSVVTSFPESMAINFSENIFQERQGSIGYGILCRFEVVFDYFHEELWLKPNKNFKAPFKHSLSGICLASQPPYYNTYQISYMYQNSPAQEAGLQVGDIILAVDKKSVADMNISNIYSLLEKESGKKVSLYIQRGQSIFQTEIVLKEFL